MMKKIILLFLTLSLTISSTFAYQELLIEKRGGKAIRVIKVVLDGQHFVVTSVAEDGGDTLQNLTKKVGGQTSVNGVFFCPDDYGYCNGVTHTISERVFMGDGKSYSRFRGDTSIRAIFGFDKNGEPLFVQKNLGIHDVGLRSDINKERLNDIYFGLGNFPVLLLEGDDVVIGSANYIDKKMKTAGNKTFICSTKDTTTIYMGVIGGITIPDMPAYLKEQFDCRNAINLDAGNSIGMIYSGFVLDQGPRTRIMDAFVVLTREEYKELTMTTPPTKTLYQPEENYILTSEDQEKVKTIYYVLQDFIKKNGDKQKWSFINLLRSALQAPIIQSDLQKKYIIKDLLFKLFIQDKL